MQNIKDIADRWNARSSNLESYRIVCMFLIVAHHYSQFYYISDLPFESKTIFLNIFGMWGKTGINCFLLITGYFMCKSNISIRKFVKLMLWIYVYKISIYAIFLFTGHETISVLRLIKLIMPVWDFSNNFVSCFIGFWLTIPFWNILLNNMTKKQHQLLMILLLGMYTFLGSVPTFKVEFNYVSWFGVLYLIASYIRLYPNNILENRKLWGWVSLVTLVLAIFSGFCLNYLKNGTMQFLVTDSNKFFAVVVAISSFLWFKNLNIPHNKIINAIGGSTFGVLLIHANSDAMRHWLWKDTVDCIGHYSLPLPHLILFSIGVVFAVFCTCIIIDQIRIKLLEESFFKWYDKKPRFQKLLSYLSK